LESLDARWVLSVDGLSIVLEANPADVNQDGVVAPVDALIVTNTLEDVWATAEQQAMVDVNQDGALTIEDFQALVEVLVANETFAADDTTPLTADSGTNDGEGIGSGSGSDASGSGSVAGGGSGSATMHPCGFPLGGASSSVAGPDDGIGDPLPVVTIDMPIVVPHEFELFNLSGTHSHVTGLQLCGTSSFIAVDFNGVGALVLHSDGTWTAQAMFMDNLNGIDPSLMTIIAIANNGLATASTSMSVSNSAPTIAGELSRAEIDEGQFTTLTVAVTDWGHQDAHTIDVDWGDGIIESHELPGGAQSEWSNNSTAMMSHAPLVRELTLPPHQYKDDDPSGTPADVYTVTFTVTDDDGASDSNTASVKVKNVKPTITITSITPIDSVPTEQGGVDGRLDETEGFVVKGTVTDPGVNDTHTATLEVDLNFDGDVDDDGETVAVPLTLVSPGNYTFEKTIARVLDDGASYDPNTHAHLWGNETVVDDFAIDVRVEDDDTGVGTASDTELVWDVSPRFIDDPNDPDDQPGVIFQFDSSDVLVSAIVNGSFADPGDEDYHDIVIAWGDGGVSFERLFPGDLAFSVQRNFSSSPPSLEDLYPIVLYVSDDDTQLDAFVLANNDCDDVSLPAYLDKIPAATVARYGPWSPTGHLALTWNHFTPMPTPLQAQQPKLLAYSKSPFPASPVILGRVAVQVEHEGLIVPAGDEDAFKAAADPHWQKLREYKKSDDEAYLKAKEKFVKHTGEASKRCWITVVKFDPGEIDKIVQTTLDQSLPNGTRVHPTNMALLAAQQNGAAKVAHILNHEQGHHGSGKGVRNRKAEKFRKRFLTPFPCPAVLRRRRWPLRTTNRARFFCSQVAFALYQVHLLAGCLAASQRQD
jgi:hypothetical protein